MTMFRLVGHNGKNKILDVPVKIVSANFPTETTCLWNKNAFRVDQQSYLELEVKVPKRFKMIDFYEGNDGNGLKFAEPKRLKK